MPTHKYFMLHYVANQHAAGDHIHRSDCPKEMLKSLKEKYQKSLQKDQIYAVFCFDEVSQSWKGFDYDEAVKYLENLVKNEKSTIRIYNENSEVLEEIRCFPEEVDREIQDRLWLVDYNLDRIEVEDPDGHAWNPI